MKITLKPFQENACKKLRRKLHRAAEDYAEDHERQIISFTAATGAGKTIILIALVESVYNGDATYPAQDDAIFVWLSDSPELNEQSRQKFSHCADDSIGTRLVTITDEDFDAETLDDGKIYFLNTQKLSRTSNLTQQSDTRTFTIWQTLQNTAAEKSARLYLIIDEAHRGANNRREATTATTIMQKFIRGSEADGLKPLPLVIGMSATIERFNALISDAGLQAVRYNVPNDDVREAGLIKEKIIVLYPDEETPGNRELSVLTAATQDWLNKCKNWQSYDATIKPVFIVQVQSGTGDNVSDTDLDACLRTIEAAVGEKFQVGEVVHTFGETADLTLNGLQVVYKEPSKISGDVAIKVVLFKENLSTGWDCPRAETMMSFRRAADSTYIAQLIGRMIRTPLQRRIDKNETLNEVCLFLPNFDRKTVTTIIDELKASATGAVTNIDGQALGAKTFETWTINVMRNAQCVMRNESAGGEVGQAAGLSLTPLELSKKIAAINRTEVFDFLNALALPTYRVKRAKTVNRLTALLDLAQLLTWTTIHIDALDEVIDSLVEMIRAKVDALKTAGEYSAAIERLTKFKLAAKVVDALDWTAHDFVSDNLFANDEDDTESQFDFAAAKLGDEAVATRYVEKYGGDDLNVGKLEVILFAFDNACADAVEKFAEKKYRKYVAAYRSRFATADPALRKFYDDISDSADEISEHNFRLPQVMTDLPRAEDGIEYADHLFVDAESRTARIRLNTWEADTLSQEQARNDFVCWLRNFERKRWALCLPYQNEHGDWKGFYPDMIIVRRGAAGYVADVLEPHRADNRDNIGKARALAKYAAENQVLQRIQLIRQVNNVLRRLDMTRGDIREKVLQASTNVELDNIFDEHGTVT